MSVFSEELVSIPQFFAGRSVFITGGTGFMGKVLVERLLTTCPDIKRLILLMRSKRGVDPKNRLADFKRSQVFDVLRKNNPAQLDKVHVLDGDITKPSLGLKDESLSSLEEVSVVFNCAATVRFDEKLNWAAQQNVLSVIYMMEICDKLPSMKVLVHVSTAYSNAEQKEVEERVYPLPRPLDEMLAEALAVSEDAPSKYVNSIISPKPNTYTYTKMLGETAVQQHGIKTYPIAIFRPSIVLSSLRNPFPGWIDTFNGPIATVAAVSKGLLPVYYCIGKSRVDVLPVDIAIDSLIAVAWETAVDNLSTVRVYNCSTSANPTTWEQMRSVSVHECRQNPLSDGLWYPTCMFVKNWYIYRVLNFVVRSIPLHLAQYTMQILKKKSRVNLIDLDRRLCQMIVIVNFFTTRDWVFRTANMTSLRLRLHHSDAAVFNLDPNAIDWKEYYANQVRGIRRFLLKEKEENLPQSRKRLQRMYFLHQTITILVPVFLTYMLHQLRRFPLSTFYKNIKSLVKSKLNQFLIVN
ncbi:putative fatty acyl-CoA reductase CG5065 isoform X2 [Ostrinia nubilalis]|uniref:putative fatty acyl-CoA reductase CG5065 isoform X2 n=1 Tax=Ostrinia nubilalis TaxID=29057 RepID=UPI00308247E2